jgi:hypothetical protein
LHVLRWKDGEVPETALRNAPREEEISTYTLPCSEAASPIQSHDSHAVRFIVTGRVEVKCQVLWRTTIVGLET